MQSLSSLNALSEFFHEAGIAATCEFGASNSSIMMTTYEAKCGQGGCGQNPASAAVRLLPEAKCGQGGCGQSPAGPAF